MTEPVDPKTGGSLRNTDTFFAVGFVFFVLGLTGDNNVAFMAVGLAFFGIGVAGRSRARKGDK